MKPLTNIMFLLFLLLFACFVFFFQMYQGCFRDKKERQRPFFAQFTHLLYNREEEEILFQVLVLGFPVFLFGA